MNPPLALQRQWKCAKDRALIARRRAFLGTYDSDRPKGMGGQETYYPSMRHGLVKIRLDGFDQPAVFQIEGKFAPKTIPEGADAAVEAIMADAKKRRLL